MHISLHTISKIIQSTPGYPPEQLLSLCSATLLRIQILGSRHTCLHTYLSHPLSHLVSIATTLYKQESFCFTGERGSEAQRR